MRLSGIVSSGLGRASIFMAQPHYQEQFLEILNEEAWPGTLNVKVVESVATSLPKKILKMF